uniref:putative methyl-CpG-binding domain protein 3-like 5 n=1 Tax=Jaculus jaculus TaxID=51337 RepID=UPI00064D6825|nr:putative methyl-CpG-binding domain protein 3-like 5 [Jaculus jaculus]
MEPSKDSFPSQPILGRLTRSMIPETLRRKRKVQVSKGKHGAGVGPALPVRITSCIFQKPVTPITSNPGSQTRRRQRGEKLERPQQLCAFGRLQGLQIRGREADVGQLDFASALKIIALGMQNKRPAGAGAGRHVPQQLTSGQSSCWRDMIHGGLTASPSLYSQGVTTADIQRQTEKVMEVRKRLAEALEADRLAKRRHVV